MGSPVPHASGDYPAHGNPQRPVLRREELSSTKSCPGEPLRKWKSLEGDWRTFYYTDQNKAERRWTTHVRGSKSTCENQVQPSRYPENGCSQSMRYRKTPGYKDETSGTEWRGEEADFVCQTDRYCPSNPSQSSEAASFSSTFRRSLHLPDREDLKRVVNSSYPLLEENLSLLQKLKKERDLCRQLENDMIDLEGQIQDVSKSFHTGGGLEVDSREGSSTNSEGGSDVEGDSPPAGGSYEQVFAGTEPNEWDRFKEPEEEGEELDPITVIETSLSSLLDLADRLELAVRERDLELRRLLEDSSLHRIPTEWIRPSFQLSRIPSELVDLLQDLQAALRLLLANRDWECGRQQGEKDCSSPASFTFQAFDDRVLVPTVRTIFSPVGDSVEMRPVEEPDGGKEEEYPSTISLGQCSEFTAEPLTFPEQTTTDTFDQDVDEEAPDLTSEDNCTPDDDPLSEELSEAQERHPVLPPPPIPDLLENQPSEIIKRIERLQELVKPELCESLKQRALRIQKAKEDFLSGVIGPPPVEPTYQEPEEEDKDIVIVDCSVPSPNGLTVKDETEEKKGKLSFLRKKKRQSWGSEELCRESLVLEDRSDWLRNPFRPKGKYKINK
ncbi:unnamed protein product [Nezara viridula]|uniref:Uncharacterized protein n=1 Tax=Nezara viridula TaxID=85310 RepID=A0A9P0GXD5_NEZVI|nr:unnamed protein product [Nezara viridula]